MKERIEKELKAVLPQGTIFNVHLPDVGGGSVDHSVWRGGSLLATQPAFERQWVPLEVYDEFGPVCVHRRCF